ncbi:hypothetical protein V6N11_010908 [Hibiscus sabdariffa]|uniref:Uncharacterized protein n=1 Tax=Hibiscus sabdariffa TaxID=183260 RepID=A0ABR2S6M2_9ROSI
MEPDEDPKTTTANKNDNLMLLKEEPMESDPHPPLALPTGVIQQMPVKIPVATAKRSYNKDRHTKVEESQYPPLAPPGSSSSLVNSAINQMGKPSVGGTLKIPATSAPNPSDNNSNNSQIDDGGTKKRKRPANSEFCDINDGIL